MIKLRKKIIEEHGQLKKRPSRWVKQLVVWMEDTGIGSNKQQSKADITGRGLHGHFVTWGGVGVEVGLMMGGVGFLLPPPDIISSVISLPPWFGSRIRIYGIEYRNISDKSSHYTLSVGLMEGKHGQNIFPLHSVWYVLDWADALQEHCNMVCSSNLKCMVCHPLILKPNLIKMLINCTSQF